MINSLIALVIFIGSVTSLASNASMCEKVLNSINASTSAEPAAPSTRSRLMKRLVEANETISNTDLRLPIEILQTFLRMARPPRAVVTVVAISPPVTQPLRP